VRLSHDPAKTRASFDDPNLVSRAGLVPVMALAQRCGLAGLAGEHVRIASPAGVQVFADLTSGPPGSPALGALPGQRRVAGPGRHLP
jgi:hypothetical protein